MPDSQGVERGENATVTGPNGPLQDAIAVGETAAIGAHQFVVPEENRIRDNSG